MYRQLKTSDELHEESWEDWRYRFWYRAYGPLFWCRRLRFRWNIWKQRRLIGVMLGAIAAFIIAGVIVLICGLLFGVPYGKQADIVMWVTIITLIGAVSGRIYLE